MRRSTRHQLKQDQFSEAARETVHWAVEHRQKLVWGGIVVAVAFALGLGVWIYQNHNESKAAQAFGGAMLIYTSPLNTGEQPQGATPSFATTAERTKAARSEFIKLADQYSGSRTGRLARYFSGVTAADLGDHAAAESDLKQVMASSDADLSSLAKLALANVYRNTNRQSDAVKSYHELIDHPTRTVAKATAQLELADLFASTQPDQARRLYQEIRQQNPQGTAGQIAEMRLQSLK